MTETKQELLYRLVKEKAEKNNVIDLNAYESGLKDMYEAITVTRCCKSDSDVVADIRNKLGSVTALIDLIKLRKTEHADYAESKLDAQILQAIESIKYIKQL